MLCEKREKKLINYGNIIYLLSQYGRRPPTAFRHCPHAATAGPCEHPDAAARRAQAASICERPLVHALSAAAAAAALWYGIPLDFPAAAPCDYAISFDALAHPLLIVGTSHTAVALAPNSKKRKLADTTLAPT